MNPVAVDLGFVAIGWYGIMAAAAMGTGTWLAVYWARRYGLAAERFEQAMLAVLVAVLVGARLGHVLVNRAYYLAHPAQVWRIDLGGLGSHGAILFGLVVGYLAARRLDLDFLTGLDSIAASIPLAHVFVRLGNFINGELYGLPTTLAWGRVFPGTAEPRHPSMLYEGLLAVVFLAMAMRWAARPHRRGETFLRTMLLVSAGRFAVDFTRSAGDGPYLGLILTQALAAAIGLACLGGLLWLLTEQQPKPEPSG